MFKRFFRAQSTFIAKEGVKNHATYDLSLLPPVQLTALLVSLKEDLDELQLNLCSITSSLSSAQESHVEKLNKEAHINREIDRLSMQIEAADSDQLAQLEPIKLVHDSLVKNNFQTQYALIDMERKRDDLIEREAELKELIAEGRRICRERESGEGEMTNTV